MGALAPGYGAWALAGSAIAAATAATATVRKSVFMVDGLLGLLDDGELGCRDRCLVERPVPLRGRLHEDPELDDAERMGGRDLPRPAPDAALAVRQLHVRLAGDRDVVVG